MMMFLEEKHYREGEKLGIKRSVMDDYFYDREMSFDHIITTLGEKKRKIRGLNCPSYEELADGKYKNGKPIDPYRLKAFENGIKTSTYNHRLKAKWSKERAATQPVDEKLSKSAMKAKRKGVKYPDWVYEELENNGVAYSTFLNRIKLGYPLEWCVLPVETKFKQLMLNRIEELEGKVKELESQLG
jgi:hypothetical protein